MAGPNISERCTALRTARKALEERRPSAYLEKHGFDETSLPALYLQALRSYVGMEPWPTAMLLADRDVSSAQGWPSLERLRANQIAESWGKTWTT